jgi:hypothetical protein
MKGKAIMAIKIGNYNFEGPFPDTGGLRRSSGVYSILGRNAEHEQWIVLDVGEAGDVQNRVSSHDRADEWKRCGYKVLSVAALYCDEQTRMRIEQELRAQFSPQCGVR